MSRKQELIKFINKKQKELFCGLLLAIVDSNSKTTKITNLMSSKAHGNWEIITTIKKIEK